MNGRHHSTDPQSYERFALEVETFIRSQARVTDHGQAWAHSPDRPKNVSYSLYNGSAGIIVFYIELFRASGNSQFLDTAVSAGRELEHFARSVEWQSCAMYTGWPGHAFSLFCLYEVTGDERFLDAGRFCLDRLHASSTSIGSGIGWIEPMPFSNIHGFEGDREIFDASVGAAGAGMVLLHAARNGYHDSAIERARLIGDRLLEVGEPALGGRNWPLMSDMPFPWSPSNFAHGAAGVGTFLGLLANQTGHDEYQKAAVDAAAHLQAISVPGGGPRVHQTGHLVAHHAEADGANLFYLSACHGPVGTSRLFNLLAESTGDPAYTKWTESALDALLSCGVPETRSKGFWNNVSQCCGDAGVGDWALRAYRQHGDERCLDLAVRVANELERRSTTDVGRSWPQAEHREVPDFLQAQTGYMQGAAGIGSFFLHLLTTLRGDADTTKIVFPDIV